MIVDDEEDGAVVGEDAEYMVLPPRSVEPADFWSRDEHQEYHAALRLEVEALRLICRARGVSEVFGWGREVSCACRPLNSYAVLLRSRLVSDTPTTAGSGERDQ